ncbi:MAG: NUDIX domain-containing protein [Magnetococcales bacterium]|nr:NUDIX domain-containing protein [Magnetococcales bacterium]
MKVEILERTKLYQGFVQLEQIRLRHERFDGQMSPAIALETVTREHDSVAILPYDPQTDTVILIRQFRIGAYLAGEAGWCVEIVAGHCTSADIVANARREVLEEIGWEVSALQPILHYYPSPNFSNERLHLFLGLIDSTRQARPGGGLCDENEDIQILPLSFTQAMNLVNTGQISTSPTLLSMQWLAQHRGTLRQQA